MFEETLCGDNQIAGRWTAGAVNWINDAVKNIYVTELSYSYDIVVFQSQWFVIIFVDIINEH